MDMRSIETATGGYGGVYNNPRREWVALETPSQTLLEFLLPPVCRPFQLESATVQLNVRAGSRKLTLYGGAPDDLKVIGEFENALGRISADVPLQLAANPALNGRFYLQIEVGPLLGDDPDASADGEQDDNYSVSRCLVTLKGQRIETSITPP
jgi:hypothetical protein